MGEVTYYDGDKEATTWEELGTLRDRWGTEENYLKSLNADYEGITNMWEDLSDSQKMAYGWNGDKEDEASMKAAREAYEATWIEIIEAAEKAEEAATSSEEQA
jgi:hypothetical protein